MRRRLTQRLGRLMPARWRTDRTADGPRPNPSGTTVAGHGLPDVRLGDVAIDYEPILDGDPDPGEVVWTWVPYEDDPSQGKDRPVVVIGRTGPTYLAGVALTSHGGHPSERVEVGTGAWDGQHRVSYAKLDRILTIDPARVRREGAILEEGRFDQLVDALRTYRNVRVARR
jgi:hypothetical protein